MVVSAVSVSLEMIEFIEEKSQSSNGLVRSIYAVFGTLCPFQVGS